MKIEFDTKEIISFENFKLNWRWDFSILWLNSFDIAIKKLLGNLVKSKEICNFVTVN